MKKRKVIIIGDSLSLPGHRNTYEETWVYLLKSYFSILDFIVFSQRALTTDVLVTQGGGDSIDNFPKGADTLEMYNPDISIIQLGIVDCAPRLFNKKKIFTKVVDYLPNKIRKQIYYIKNKHIGRSVKNAYVSPDKFRSNIDNYISRAFSTSVKKIILVGICNPDNRLISKNPKIANQIKIYNNILNKFSCFDNRIVFINPLDQSLHEVEIFEDGYHLNSNGHRILFDTIKSIINV